MSANFLLQTDNASKIILASGAGFLILNSSPDNADPSAGGPGLTGHWRGPARKKHTPGQPRLLSELDPKPLFTPEQILSEIEAAEPQEVNVDRAGLAAAALSALDASAKVRLEHERERARLALLADDDDNFIMVM